GPRSPASRRRRSAGSDPWAIATRVGRRSHAEEIRVRPFSGSALRGLLRGLLCPGGRATGRVPIRVQRSVLRGRRRGAPPTEPDLWWVPRHPAHADRGLVGRGVRVGVALQSPGGLGCRLRPSGPGTIVTEIPLGG